MAKRAALARLSLLVAAATIACSALRAQGDVILSKSYTCPPGAAVAKCAAYACDPAYIQYPDCDAASAPGASCEIAPCIAGFLDNGYQVPVCSALWRQADGSVGVCTNRAVTGQGSTGQGSTGSSTGGGAAGGFPGDGGAGSEGGDTEGSAGTGGAGAGLPTGCVCPMFYSPVCGEDGQTYGNACQAACAKATVVARGPCFPTCPEGKTAACLVDPCSIPGADGQKPVCKAEPAATCRYSTCSETLVLEDGSEVGPCSAVWIHPVNGMRVDCDAEVAGDGGLVIMPGPIDESLNPFAGCLGNVRCAKDSCALPRCAKAAALPASAVCFQLTCSGQSLNGADVEPCSAVWVDPDTKEVVVCGGEDDEDETPDSGSDISCPSGVTAACFADPCSVLPADCPWATAPAGAATAGSAAATAGSAPATAAAGFTCEASYCDKGVLPDGSVVGPCTAVFRSTTDGSILGTCPAAQKPQPEEDDLNPFSGCLGNVRCAGDPCAAGPCAAAQPDWRCFPVTCSGQSLDGVPVAPCSAVWVDPESRDAVVCPAPDTPVEKPVVTCPSGVTAACFADPCAVPSAECRWAEVKDAKCEANYCVDGLLPDGSKVGPCTAVYTLPDGTVGACPAATAPTDDCVCTLEYMPVCGSDGKTYGNECAARCTLPPGGSYTPGACGDGGGQSGTDGSSGSPVKCPSGEHTSPCFVDPCSVPPAGCPWAALSSAQCYSSTCLDGQLADGTKVGPCTAVYRLFDGSVKTCPQQPPSCGCTKEYRPVCGVSNNVTYGNKCMAACELGEGEGKWTDGPCGGTKPGGGDEDGCVCIELYKPVCGADGKTYGNGCQAGCAKVEVVHAGVCAPSCPPGPAVTCAVNPCLVAKPCAADPPVAACTYTTCAAATYTDAAGTETAVLPCAPIWLDDNGALIKCDGGGGTPKNCAGCPTDYAPVCATGWRPDPVTFPNRCAAECAGGTVQKAGKCEHCNGGECTIGKKNDICFLAGHKNCWSKKYSCQVPANPDAVPPSGGSTQVFGRCLPKTPARLHHLRHLARAMLGDIIEEEADE